MIIVFQIDAMQRDDDNEILTDEGGSYKKQYSLEATKIIEYTDQKKIPLQKKVENRTKINLLYDPGHCLGNNLGLFYIFFNMLKS